jgi:3-oxoacyl-(acyl-carrier-protein) synthase
VSDSSDSEALLVMNLLADGRITADQASALLAGRAAGRPAPGAGPVAVLGTALRLPGAHDPDELWARLAAAEPLVTALPTSRFDLVVGANPQLDRQFGALREQLGTDPRSHGGWIDGVDRFDPEAFGLTAFEAGFMGPAERLLLQVAHEALVRSGIRPDRLRGSRTGVFGAYQPSTSMEYLRLFDDPDERAFISNLPANVLYRLAYTYDLRGPVLGVDTTCSSSLAALHVARRALLAGDCDLAVVAGVSLSLFPFWTGQADHFMLSPRHLCSSYDARADGIVWGEGIIAVVLERAEDAERSGHRIGALLTGSAVTSDGASNGMPAPNPDAHYAAVRAALAEAGVPADRIGYVEGHGAGTVLGDAAELDALTRAFRADTGAVGAVRLGSVKAVFGHLGDSAGLAGLLEAMLCLRHRAFPGLAGLTHPNPALTDRDSPFAVGAASAPWPDRADGEPRRAGVSSLGISGTNVHVILEEVPDNAASAAAPVPSSAAPGAERTPVFLSARSRQALGDLVRRLAERLDEGAGLSDVAYTLARRGAGPVRLGLFAADTADLLGKLQQVQSVRAFERIPDHFGDQGVLPADAPEAVAYSLGKLAAGAVPGAPDDLTLMAAYLRGADTDEACLDRLAPGRVLDLPLAPPAARRIWPGADRAADVAELFFRAEWVEAGSAAAAVPSRGRWLVLARPDDEEARELVRLLRAAGAGATLATAAAGFAELGPGHYGFDPADDGHYDRLWQAVGPLGELAGIVHLLGRGSAQDPMADAAALAASQQDGVFSLFRLGRSLIRLGRTEPLLLAAVAARVHRISPDELGEPARATGFGFLRVLSQEVPAVAELAIDHDFAGPPAQTAAQLAAELAAGPRGRTALVAYRAGRRYTKVVNRSAGEGGGTALTVRPGGTYLLAGGTGFLGMQVGCLLAERGAGTIVLLSRSGLPPRETWADAAAASPAAAYTFEAIGRMEQSGARVRLVTGDLTDAAGLQRAFAEVRAGSGLVHGAFMLAKELFHTWIEELDFDRFRRGVDNRVLGTWLLAEQLRADRPDFLVLFSSVSSMTGTKGAAECAAVNQYLDAAAPRLTAAGVPAYTINLPLILDDQSGFAAKSPIPPIDLAQFRGALERFLRDAHPLDVVTRLDLAEVHYLREVLRIPFGPEVWREAARHAEPAGESRAGSSGTGAAGTGVSGGAGGPVEPPGPARIEQVLAEAWQGALGRPAAGPAENFFTAGGTSLSAVRLAHLIGRALPAAGFDVAALYGHATFAAQVDYCTQRLHAPAGEAGGQPADDLDAILARVQSGELSETEAARLLSAGLGADSGAGR